MKYMIMLYGSQQDYAAIVGAPSGKPAWDAAEVAAMGRFMALFTADLVESGELIDTRGLGAPAQTRRIQVIDGAPVVTDGPYPETQEVLAGYWLVECDADRAVQIATRLTQCPGPSGYSGSVIDLRPVADSRAELES